MKYYNNIVYINGGSDDGWQMVLPRRDFDQEKIAISPDSEKNSNIHNYFVFEGRKTNPNVATDSQNSDQQVSFL